MIKVDFKKPILFILGTIIFTKKRLFQFIVCVLINLFLPVDEFRLFIILNDPKDVTMEPLNIFIFLSFCDTISESFKFFEWFIDSVF